MKDQELRLRYHSILPGNIPAFTSKKIAITTIANHFLYGGKDLSILLKQRGYETAVPLFPSKLTETLAVVNATATRVRKS